MKTSTISFALSLLALTSAQTPADFPIQSDATVDVDYTSSKTTIKTGALEAQADVAEAPTLTLPNADGDTTYVAIMVDATYPYLHLLAPNLEAEDDGTLKDDGDDNGLVGSAYFPPAPPKADGPHEYVVLIYEQPDDWAIPDAYSNVNPSNGKDDLNGFDVNDFVGASGLTTLVGANYFRVEPGSSSTSSGGNGGNGGGASAASAAASSSAASASASAKETGTSDNAAGALTFGPVHWVLTGLLLLAGF